MPFLIKLLKAGSANGAAVGLYTATASPAIVSNIRLVNAGGGNATTSVYYHPYQQSAVLISERNKVLAPGDILIIKPELTLAASDSVESSTSAAVDYVVSGVEKV